MTERPTRHLPPVGIDPESLADTFCSLVGWMIDGDRQLRERGFDSDFIFRLERRALWNEGVERFVRLWEYRWDSWMYAVMGWDLDEGDDPSNHEEEDDDTRG